MDELNFNGRRVRPWNMYVAASNNNTVPAADNKQGGSWGSFGSSMNAISFGFVATAILISMFLIMAVFERLLGSSSNTPSGETESLNKQHTATPMISNASDFSVLMPGQRQPTFIAQPAPLPCSREGVDWPHHQHTTTAHT